MAYFQRSSSLGGENDCFGKSSENCSNNSSQDLIDLESLCDLGLTPSKPNAEKSDNTPCLKPVLSEQTLQDPYVLALLEKVDKLSVKLEVQEEELARVRYYNRCTMQFVSDMSDKVQSLSGRLEETNEGVEICLDEIKDNVSCFLRTYIINLINGLTDRHNWITILRTCMTNLKCLRMKTVQLVIPWAQQNV